MSGERLTRGLSTRLKVRSDCAEFFRLGYRTNWFSTKWKTSKSQIFVAPSSDGQVKRLLVGASRARKHMASATFLCRAGLGSAMQGGISTYSNTGREEIAVFQISALHWYRFDFKEEIFSKVYKKISCTREQEIKTWCPKTDSNRRPTAYKAVALPTELLRQELLIIQTRVRLS